MGSHVAAILALMAFGALVWSAGFSYFIRKAKRIALAVLLLSAAGCWWASHYLIQLSLQSDLPSDLQWHRVYMIWLLVFIPGSLVIGGVIGLIRHQKDYLSQYESRGGISS